MKKLMILFLLLFANPAFATVSDGETIRQYFTCNNSTTEFTFTFKCNSADDVLVYKHLISTGVETLLTENSDYSISATGSDYLNGGVVTTTDTYSSDYKIVIVRSIKQSQEITAGAITPTSAAAALDKITRQVQDLQDLSDRSIRLQQSDGTGFDMELADLNTRGSTYLGFDSDGDLTYYSSTIDDGATVSSYMATVLDEADKDSATAELGTISAVNVKHSDYGAVGDGVTDDTTAFENAQAALGSDGGTIFIPEGNYILNDFEPDSKVRFVGIGLRKSRIQGTTSQPILINTGTTTHCQFENLAFVTINGRSCVKTEDDGYAGHFLFRDCNFEAPSEYGCYGNFVLSTWDNCNFGYWPAGGEKIHGGVYLKASAGGSLASNQNLFTFCKFYYCEIAAITITAHGYGNTFFACDFESLDNKVANITQGGFTRFINCWAEDINIDNNAENCVIKFGSGNTSTSVIDGFRLGGTQNNTNKFFYIFGATPKIRYQNSYTDYDNFTIITLTGHNTFWYYSNRNSGTNVTIDGSGIYNYYKDSNTTIPSLDDDATPSVAGNDIWLTGGTTSITDFDNGMEGKKIVLVAAHSVKITNGTNIILRGNTDFDMVSGDILTLVQKADTYWYEMARSHNTDGVVLTETVELTSDQIKDLADTPVTLVAAQGADTIIEFLGAVLIYDAAVAYAEPSAPDDMVIEYDTGTDLTDSIDATGFITVTDDEIRRVPSTLALTTDLVPEKNAAIQLFNTGTDYTTGTGTMTVKINYRVHTLGL